MFLLMRLRPRRPRARRSPSTRLAAALVLALAAAAPAAPGGEGTPVVLPVTFDVSPDGSTVVFSWRGDLWSVPVAGGSARRLTSHPAEDHSPRFSPGGDELAFVSDRYPGGQIFCMPARGGPPRQLTWHTDGFRLQGWYPDGTALLAGAARDDHWRHADRFFRIERDRRVAPRRLFNAQGHDGRLSPDGTHILFVREGERWWRKGYRGSRAAQIWWHELGTGRYRKLSEDGIPHEWPLWSSDGRRVYYVSEKSGTRNLWALDPASGARTQLTRHEDDGVTFPALAHGGTVIVYRRLFDLYALDLADGASPRRIPIRYDGDSIWPLETRVTADRAASVAYTADGKQIAFVAGGDVWVMDRELREPRRVTDSPEHESDVCFSPDGEALYFVRTADGGHPDIWRAEREPKDAYWWRCDRFTLTRITDDPEQESALSFRPDGKRLAFVKRGGELWTIDPDGGNAHRVLAGWDAPNFAWSPDGKWFVYAVQDDTFNSDIWVIPADGSEPPYNLSRHPDRDASPAWSPDGRKIAFTGRRTNRETEVFYVHLRKEDEEVTARDRKLEKALEAMKGKEKPAPRKKSEAGGGETPADDGEAKPAGKKPGGGPGPKPRGVEVRIDFEDLHRRVRRIALPEGAAGSPVWSKDSKRLVFPTSVKGVRGLYAVEIPSDRPTPKLFSSTTLASPRWLASSNELVGLDGGVPTALSATGAAKKFPFVVRQRIDLPARRTTTFDAAWRIMRERFYDGGFNNRDWDAVRTKYRAVAGDCLGSAEFSVLVHLMLGELNASHLGFRAGSAGRASRPADAWAPATAHLGLLWEEGGDGPGLRIREVIPDGPAAREKSRLEPGEVVLAVDGHALDPDTDLTEVLNRGTDHDYRLRVRDADGAERAVTLRATTTPAVRRLLYEKIVRDRQALVDRLSGGTLAYCHIAGMNWPSFERFQAELYALGWGKDGLLIDVRDNGGGSTADHLLTALCQPRHAITVPRRGGPGYPRDRRVYASWHKPIVVLCNQNSFSNAEIFTHAVKQLGRGRVVGVPTAGGVISTGAASVLGEGIIRTPFRGWFLLNGEDMERHGATPDFTIWPPPGELAAGRDRQLEKAAEVLLEDVATWKAKPLPKLRYARERREGARKL